MLNKTGSQSEPSNSMTVGETKITEVSVADPTDEKVSKKKFSRGVILFLTAAALAIVVVVVFGVHSRTLAASRLVEATDQAAIPTVNLVHPQAATRAQDLVLPGNTQAFIDSPIFARTNGYLKRWHVDIGDGILWGAPFSDV